MNPWKSTYKSKQGNIGLGMAIAYFTNHGIPISIPLNDTQHYDLVIDINGKLERVSVKTTQGLNKSKKFYCVVLKNSGGSSGKSKIRPFDKNSCDYLFVYTKSNELYFIPSNVIMVKNTLTLTPEYKKYQVFI